MDMQGQSPNRASEGDVLLLLSSCTNFPTAAKAARSPLDPCFPLNPAGQWRKGPVSLKSPHLSKKLDPSVFGTEHQGPKQSKVAD